MKPMLSKWALVVLFGLEAHFAASYLVPLDERSGREFGGLLRWFWPWSYGDAGLLGQISPASGFPIVGFWVALVAAVLLGMATLAAAGWWVPSAWCPALAGAGAAALLCLMGLFLGPTKVIPMLVALGTLYLAVSKPALLGAS
jgi:hypothetical protein